MDVEPPARQPLPAELEEYVAQELGPGCMNYFHKPQVVADYQKLRNTGAAVEDAALHLVHRESSNDPIIADEFFAHFLASMMKVGTLSMRNGMRRYLDSGDLVNSVAGSLWKDLASTEFTTRKEYLGFLGRRLGWKASDRAQGLNAAKRRQDLQLDVDFQAVGFANEDQAGPATVAGNQEDIERLIAILPRLNPRDQGLIRRTLRGEEVSQIAEALKMNPDSTRKALARAIEKAKRFL